MDQGKEGILSGLLSLLTSNYKDLTGHEKQHLKDHFTRINFRNSIVALVILFSLNAVTELLFVTGVLDSQVTNPVKQTIRITAAVSAGIILLFAFFAKSRFKSFVTAITLILVFLYGIIFTLEAQTNHARLTVYVSVMISVSIYFGIRKIFLILAFVIVHAIFLTGLILIQSDPQLLVSGMINSTAVVVVSAGLAMLRYESAKKIVISNLIIQQREEEARKANLFLEKITKLGNAGGWEYDRESDTVTWAETTRIIYGVDSEYEPTPEKVFNFCADEESRKLLQSAIKKAVTEKSHYEVQIQIRRKDGEIRWIQAIGAPEYEDGQWYKLIGFVQDITVFRNEYDRILKLKEAREKFLNIISHDLRGPAGNVKFLASVMKSEMPESVPDSYRRMVDLNERAAGQLFNLLDDLLRWARLQAGNFTFNPQVHQLRAVVNNVLSQLKPGSEQKRVGFVVQIREEATVFADKDMLSAIIRNITSNAVKFSRAGDFVEIESDEYENRITITVKDTGTGMSKQEVEQLFDQTRKHRSKEGTAGEQGSGLGLMLCKDFTELNNGTITVVSEPDKGSAFTIDLPAVPPDS